MVTSNSLLMPPASRRIRIFSYDPALATRLDFAGIAELTIAVPWEDDLEPGPIGEYIEVVDVDPASDCVYAPVDLDNRQLLATDGLAPSESNPQFHQQMCYAVAMATIRHFERALGRLALWSGRREGLSDRFVRRLRIYPHALRARNAYYSHEKKALLFGYFPVERRDRNHVPGTLVFTCLSHDIIAHEVTHALLDGAHPRFAEPMNVDVLAFHEAFADIVALFQHFSYPGILRDQIARTRGNLAEESLLGQLAQQFGEASGRGGALRNYLGKRDPTGKWEPVVPDPRLLETMAEPHDRGAILVAAVFGAFMKVYRSRTRDLYRIATEGTGVLREGDIHPDLVGRLADEAARCADYILQMCIRGIDYCPPVGVTFGAYLRGVITADFDMVPEDRHGFRIAFMESFREWGINPPGVLSLSMDSLLWPTSDEAFEELAKFDEPSQMVTQASVVDNRGYTKQRAPISSTRSSGEIQERTSDLRAKSRDSLKATYGKRQTVNARAASSGEAADDPKDKIWLEVATRLGLSDDRLLIWKESKAQRRFFWRWLMAEDLRVLAPALGIVLSPEGKPLTISRKRDMLAVEIHAVRTALRPDRRQRPAPYLIVEITQRRYGYFDLEIQKKKDSGESAIGGPKDADFIYRAGCTLLIDAMTMDIRRIIRTRGTIDDDTELARMREYLTVGGLERTSAFSGPIDVLNATELLALLHDHGEG